MDTTKHSALLQANRLILCHFDSYSTALVFARWPDGSLLAPMPLPASAQPGVAPAEIDALHAVESVMPAALSALEIGDAELKHTSDFDAWMHSEAGTIRIHLLRFTCFEAPAQRIEPRGGVFRPISALRGAAVIELGLVRQVFDLIMGGGGR